MNIERPIRFILAGKSHGLLDISWTPDETKVSPIDVGIPTNSPFGVALRGDEMIFSPDQQTLYRKRPIIGLSEIEFERRPYMDWHGAIWDDEGYYVTSSSYGVACLLTCPETEDFCTDLFWLDLEYQKEDHLNAILKKDEFFYLSYHRLTQKIDENSQVLKFVSKTSIRNHATHLTLRQIEQYELGKDIHDLVDIPGHGIVTSSSLEFTVLGVDFDYRLPVEPSERVGISYIRGMCYQDGVLIVGKNHYSNHTDERRWLCQINLYNFETQKLIGRIDLPQKGTIHQLLGRN